MNTEQRQRAESLLKDKWAWCPFDPKYFPNFIDVMIDFHKQELQRIGQAVYVPVSVVDGKPPLNETVPVILSTGQLATGAWLGKGWSGIWVELKFVHEAVVTHWLKKLNLVRDVTDKK